MRLVFNIEYYTEFGQSIHILGDIPELGSWDDIRAPRMTYTENGQWRMELFVNEKNIDTLSYRYILKDDRYHSAFHEWGAPRQVDLAGNGFIAFHIIDHWRPVLNEDNALFASAFTNNLWSRKKSAARKKSGYYNHQFCLYAPRIDENHYFCIVGNDDGLGKWDPEKVVIMKDDDYPLWKAEAFLEGPEKPIIYKYGIYDKKEKKLVAWEAGPNRTVDHDLSVIDNTLVINTDQGYNYPKSKWKGAGIAIPVFSLRSKKSYGIGEFPDLKLLIDWAVKSGMKLVQLLPVNDTIAHHAWTDSYPYAAISVFALHPIYLNLPVMGTLKDKKAMDDFKKQGEKLNEKPEVDFEAVIKLKSRFYKNLYDQEKNKFLADPEYKSFFEKNKDWLVPYAAFSCLRDRFHTPDFTQWDDYVEFDQAKIYKLVDPKRKNYDDIAVHYFIQFHLHKQLSEVVAYAREKGVALKGDLPIGIYRNSVDAWVEPRLYRMDKQAGAPPDAYSISGQNWRFPTYNWEEMANDGYTWWRRRLSQMAKYFDAYRIDHILGFFRIWEISWEAVEGLMGIFNPAIPIYKHEIEGRGIYFDFDRFCKPYIREFMLDEMFGEFRDEVKKTFLNQKEGDLYKMKPEFDTQRKILVYFDAKKVKNKNEIRKNDLLKYGLFSLIGEILFIEDPGSNREAFHPKIAFHRTYSYRDLDDYTKNILNEIYTNYFYHRQENFWRDQAMIKLPAIIEASNMLVCGEDLGMVPDCVPGVMYELGILRLYIERMPKEGSGEFAHAGNAPYLSVVSTSSHDMATLRGWWEEDRSRSQRYYNQILGHNGEVPYYCEGWVAEQIIIQHLYSPAMWSIFPVQDLLAMEPELRREDPLKERINDPSNPNNYWNYRLHLNLEDLIKEDEFNHRLAELISMTGRAAAF